MKKILTLLLAVMTLMPAARADEGMWTLYNLDQRTYDKMRAMGFELTQEELYNELGTSLKDCVVLFGGFCSGVVVSDQGLVFTNHHCGYSAINALSTTDDDILKNGFAAQTLADERPTDDLWVAFLERVIDLTEAADNGLDVDSISKNYRDNNPGTMTTVEQFFGGNVTLMQVYRKYGDVRLAFAPTETLGKFGGDTDNWMWPRHTSDFSVFRVYARPDGTPTEGYEPENVPLRPRRWARVSLDGYDLNDFCMTVGFPGSTNRYMSSWGIEQRMACDNAAMISCRGVKQEVWQQWMESDRAIDLKYSTKYAHSSNYWKNSIGMNRAIEMLGVVERKVQLQDSLRLWIAADPARQARYGTMLAELEADYAAVRETYRAFYFTYETFSDLEILSNAKLMLDEINNNAASNDIKIKAREQMRNYDSHVDRAAAVALLNNYLREVPSQYYVPFIYEIVDDYKGDVEAWVNDFYMRSTADDYAFIGMIGREQFFDVLYNDPAVDAYIDYRRGLMRMYFGIGDELERIEANENLLTQAILEMQADEPHYSDANMTMRLSYGTIRDYTGTDGQHQDYQTWPMQLVAKANTQDEVPDYRMEADIIRLMSSGDWGRYADRRQNDLPLCFLSTNDITGGNSGSPMFNGRGELIGLAFDGNWDSMSGDITFEPELQRCIGVDIRWVMFLMDKWGHADRLVNEVLK